MHIVTRDVERVGSRPAALFLHAYPLDHRMWNAVVERLDGMPVMMVDAPGFGKTPATVDAPSLDAYADEIAASIGRYGVERVMVVGCSFGGHTALALAARHPHLISGIAMVGSRADADSPSEHAGRIENLVSLLAEDREAKIAAAVTNMMSESTRRSRPQALKEALEWAKDATREGITWAQRAIGARPDRLHILENLGVPGLVVRGEDDLNSTPEQAEDMAAALGTKVVNIRNCGHLIPIEDPAALSPHLMTLYPQCR